MPNSRKLADLGESAIILDSDVRSFPPRPTDTEVMANRVEVNDETWRARWL